MVREGLTVGDYAADLDLFAELGTLRISRLVTSIYRMM
jgi:hypothetical protein